MQSVLSREIPGTKKLRARGIASLGDDWNCFLSSPQKPSIPKQSRFVSFKVLVMPEKEEILCGKMLWPSFASNEVSKNMCF
jgi:hypothetical protein